MEGRLRLLNWVEEADLPALYAEAFCFVYPSEYEGFGLQLCEAMAVGCPVLAANATCLPEVLGDGGETFSLENETGLTALIIQLFATSDLRNALQARAKRQSQAYSWQQTAQKTLATYSHCLSSKSVRVILPTKAIR